MPSSSGLPTGAITKGQKIGHATVLHVTRARMPVVGASKGKRSHGVEPWGRVLSAEPLRIVLAFSLPPRILSPNGRPNRFAKAKAVKAHREVAAMVSSEAMVSGSPWSKAVAMEKWYFPDLARRDVRNFESSLKAIYDGICDGGLLTDDSADVLTHLPSEVDVDREFPRVEVTLERKGSQ